ncbi:Uncharacterized protein GBIM_11401 [Gryllus bimaculatus]|nr:Uncharacterized protein GBIM_11401 [Gryllus bimaculatus]
MISTPERLEKCMTRCASAPSSARDVTATPQSARGNGGGGGRGGAGGSCCCVGLSVKKTQRRWRRRQRKRLIMRIEKEQHSTSEALTSAEKTELDILEKKHYGSITNGFNGFTGVNGIKDFSNNNDVNDFEEVNIKEVDKNSAPDPAPGKDDEKVISVPYFSLFRYATGCERALVALGLLLGVLTGLGQPVIIILYGEFTTLLVDRNMDNITSTPTSLLWIFGGGRVGRVRRLFLRAVLRQEMAWFDTRDPSSFASRLTESFFRRTPRFFFTVHTFAA